MNYKNKLYVYILLATGALLVLFRAIAGEGFAYGKTSSMMVTEKAIDNTKKASNNLKRNLFLNIFNSK